MTVLHNFLSLDIILLIYKAWLDQYYIKHSDHFYRVHWSLQICVCENNNSEQGTKPGCRQKFERGATNCIAYKFTFFSAAVSTMEECGCGPMTRRVHKELTRDRIRAVISDVRNTVNIQVGLTVQDCLGIPRDTL